MIRLNLSTDYALRTLLYLGSRPDKQASIREITTFYGISADHVSKVVQHLARAGYVRGERGRSGGVRLARAPEAISVGDVVELFEGRVALLDCVQTDDVCVIQPQCRLRRVLERAGSRLIEDLRGVTLAELVAAPRSELISLTLAGSPADQT